MFCYFAEECQNVCMYEYFLYKKQIMLNILKLYVFVALNKSKFTFFQSICFQLYFNFLSGLILISTVKLKTNVSLVIDKVAILVDFFFIYYVITKYRIKQIPFSFKFKSRKNLLFY